MLNLVPAERIVGFMPLLYLEFLAQEASQHERIVEIGCWRGRSTRVLCDNSSGQVTAVDHFQGAPDLNDDMERMQTLTQDPDWLFHEFQRNLDGVRNLELCRMDSLSAAQYFTRTGRSFDLIFLDALHDHDHVLGDLQAWMPLLRAGGTFCVHDFTFPEVRSAIQELFPSTLPIPEDADMWVLRK